MIRWLLVAGAIISVVAVCLIGFWPVKVYQLVYFNQQYQIEFQPTAWEREIPQAVCVLAPALVVNLKFKQKRLWLYDSQRQVVWSSPQEFKVTDYFCADVDGDKQNELGLVLYKRGYYGQALPFFVQTNPQDYGQHLFLYSWRRGQLQPKWQSSTLSKPIQDLVVADLNQDGLAELLMLEQAGRRRQLAVWQWEEWGFTKLYEDAGKRWQKIRLIAGQVLAR